MLYVLIRAVAGQNTDDDASRNLSRLRKIQEAFQRSSA